MKDEATLGWKFINKNEFYICLSSEKGHVEEKGSMFFLPLVLLSLFCISALMMEPTKSFLQGQTLHETKALGATPPWSLSLPAFNPTNHPQKFWCLPHKYVLGFLWYPRIYEVAYHPLSQCCYLPKIHWKYFRKEKQGTGIGNTPAWIIYEVKGPFPLKSQEIPGKFLEGAVMHTLCSVPQGWAEIITLRARSQSGVKQCQKSQSCH